MKVVLITGISGSGKSIAVNALEDDGYFCIDNLPMQFLQDAVAAVGKNGLDLIGVAIDSRSGDVRNLGPVAASLAKEGHDVKRIFLNARTDVLIQRFSESRRRHPLTLRAPKGQPQPTLWESIEQEREMMSDLQESSMTIDTSDLHPNALRQWLRDMVGSKGFPMTIVFQSFAYKYGIPLDADLVFDVRCLPNPYYIPELRPLTGRDEPVAQYLQSNPSVVSMIDDISHFLESWLPKYVLDQRSYLTVGIGCTGGQHRSVYCAESLSKRFAHREKVLVRHRAIEMRAASAITGTQSL